MEIAVVGAGIGGLGTALMLAQAGHRVTVLERDPAPPSDPEETWERWDRRGVPQLRLAHVFLGRMRNLLRDEQPAVYDALMRAGANEMRWCDAMSPAIADRSPRPVDADLAMLGVRRPVLEQLLRDAVAGAGGEIRSSTAVTGLLTGDEAVPGIPHVRGVRLEDGTTIETDLVVDCSGRRSPLPDWLSSIGARPMPEEVVEDGLMYFGRYYRLEDGAEYPDMQGGPIIDLGFLFGLTFKADAGWFAIALAVHSEDRSMRALRDAEVFEAVLQAIPSAAKWRTPGRSRPMTEVKTMASIDDRWRDFVVDGAPLATGLLPLGDSLVATNPAIGRGSSLAWIAARALADIVSRHEGDPLDIATAYHAAVHELIRPFYDQNAQMDAQRLEHMRRTLAGEPTPPPDPDDPFVAFATGFQLAALVDPEAFRAMGLVAHVMDQPVNLLADPHLAAVAIQAWEARDTITPTGPSGPTRDDLLAVMERAGADPQVSRAGPTPVRRG